MEQSLQAKLGSGLDGRVLYFQAERLDELKVLCYFLVVQWPYTLMFGALDTNSTGRQNNHPLYKRVFRSMYCNP
eukprot:4528355-Amphidinium_carterae.1